MASAGFLVGLTSTLDLGSRDLPHAPLTFASTRFIEPGLLDPRPTHGLRPGGFGVARPLSSEWRASVARAPIESASRVATLSAATSPTTAAPATGSPTGAASLQGPSLLLASAAVQISVPLPVPRPADLVPANLLRPARIAGDRTQTANAAPPDERSFLEKLFGTPARTEAGVTYASLDTRPLVVAPSPRITPAPSADGGVAVYDISARSVTLPNGERLEAHSGLGDRLDDPRSVHIRMRGATPPGEYELKEREQLFHGVRALRLNPVGGAGAVFGRAGLLAHTFMLGPNGDSNGCVSFRDYERFLQAYLRGEIRRLVVVIGNGGGSGFPGRHFGMPDVPAARNRDT